MRTKLKSWVKALLIGGLIVTPSLVLAQAFNPISGFAPLSGSVLRQTVANSYAGKVTLAAGLATITFQFPYTAIPSCQGTEETTAGRYPQISAVSATAVSFTSSVTASNTDVVDWSCTANPN